MSLREFAGAAPTTALSAQIGAASTSFTVTSGGGTGYPTGASAPFIVCIDRDTAGEEKILCTRSGDTFTVVTRGYDDTTASAHGINAPVEHVGGAIDFREANAHVNASSGVHGRTGAVVGTTDTQTLTNKTLTTPTIGSFTNAQHDHSNAAGGGTAVPPAFKGVRATTASQSIPNSTETAVLWTAETYDTDAYHDAVTNTSRFTVPAGKAGYYRVSATVSFNANASGQRYALLRKNGSTAVAYDTQPGSASASSSVKINDVINLAVGDYIEILVFQSSGGALSLDSTNASNYASMSLLGT